MSIEKTVQALRERAAGLVFSSESDEPCSVVYPISETSLLDEFGDQENEGYLTLRNALEGYLEDIRVIRYGDVEDPARFDVYIIGTCRQTGEWVGLRTASVET